MLLAVEDIADGLLDCIVQQLTKAEADAKPAAESLATAFVETAG